MSQNGHTPFVEEDLPILPKFIKDMRESLGAAVELNGNSPKEMNGKSKDVKLEANGSSVNKELSGTVEVTTQEINGKTTQADNSKQDCNDASVQGNNGTISVTNGKAIVDGSIIKPGPTTPMFPMARYTHISTSQDANEYRMDYPNRGCCLIFNHSRFEPNLRMPTRHGANTDRDGLKILFTQLGFDVEVCNDFSVKDVSTKLHQYAYEVDHAKNDCFVMFFLTHGEDGLLYTRDNTIDIEKIFKDFTADNCTSLAGKPKMFFIQACRGEGVERSVSLLGPKDQTDSGDLTRYSIPSNADFLTCYSTVNEHYSWRNTINGAWFIQSIINVFRREAEKEDVLSMMTNVNRFMILNFTSNIASSPTMHNRKQTANICSTLMRKVYLRPKQ